MKNTTIYLCNAQGSMLGSITGIKADTCSLTQNATDFWELSFEVDRYVEVDGALTQSSYYDSIDDMMRLYLDSESTQAFFVIDSEPVIRGTGLQETKSVTAHSIECELSNVYLKSFKVNCGTSDSQEYLPTDSNGNFYNINPYTGLPYEYISLVNYQDIQLSLLHLVLQNTGWTVKEGIDEEICDMKGSFDTSDSVYSFLMKTVSPYASVIFEFDRKHKTVGVVKAADYGKDTGVFITMRNLMNSFEVTSSSQDSIMTKLTPKGANGLGIEYVNFGKDYIINLDYFMNELNEYGDYKFVSRDLHDKYNVWKERCDKDRELYRELTKEYNSYYSRISELRNRVPNDGCYIDYTTYSLEELKTSLTAYKQALAALITAYKNEYGVTGLGDAPGYSPTPKGTVSIKDTPYWYDFYAYRESIIPQIEEALKLYCQTDSNGNLMVNADGDYIELGTGNTDYYADSSIVKTVDSYLYEWSLYGLDELEAKKKAWTEAANILYNECFILSGTASCPTAYRTADSSGWNLLTPEQKASFTSQNAYINQLNSYLDYMSLDDNHDNALTGTKGKGIIRQCEDAITERESEISILKGKQGDIDDQRNELAQS